MSKDNLVAKIGQIATQGKHKNRFLYVGTVEPKNLTDCFFYLIEIDTPWVNGEKIRDAIVFELLENQHHTDGKITADQFEQTVKKINDNLAELAGQGEHEWIGKLNSIIGIVSGNEIIFSQTGNISGYLFRADKISHITEKPLDKSELLPQKTFLSIINGEVGNNDKVIIANSKLYSHISLDRLRQTLTSMKYKDAIDELSKSLRKIKIKDVNVIIFDFLNSKEVSNDQTEKPNIIILDDIPESKFLHYSKIVYKGTVSRVKQTGRGIKTAVSWWEKNIQPKITKKIKNVSGKAKNISANTIKPVSEKFSGLPKINYFNQEHKSKNTRTKSFFTNLIFWLKELGKTENRKYLYIGIIILLLGIGFIKIQINSRNNSGVKSQAESLANLNSARDLYATAIDDLGLNRNGGKDKLIESRNLAENATDSPAIKDEARNLLIQIQTKLDELNNAQRISPLSEANYTIDGDQSLIYATGADIYSFSINGEIFKYDTRKKSSSMIASIGENDGKIVSFAYSDTSNVFYLYTDKQKIIGLDLSTNIINDLNLTVNSSWESAVGISIFSTNIYLLDSEAGTIWKHTKNNEDYSTGSNYLPRPTTSITGAKSLAIDGDIYVLNADGNVVKIRRSIIDSSFAINGTPTPENQIVSPTKIFTDADTTTIFIFDKSGNRVLEYSKTGQYKRQFVADKEIEITDFAVNTKIQKLWLLSQNNIYELEI